MMDVSSMLVRVSARLANSRLSVALTRRLWRSLSTTPTYLLVIVVRNANSGSLRRRLMYPLNVRSWIYMSLTARISTAVVAVTEESSMHDPRCPVFKMQSQPVSDNLRKMPEVWSEDCVDAERENQVERQPTYKGGLVD
jgi:hypothetical protein